MVRPPAPGVVYLPPVNVPVFTSSTPLNFSIALAFLLKYVIVALRAAFAAEEEVVVEAFAFRVHVVVVEVEIAVFALAKMVRVFRAS